MEVSLSRDVQAKLARLAAERGPDAEALAREAIERFVDDEWFIKQVERAWRKSPGGVLTHEKGEARMERLLTEKQPRA